MALSADAPLRFPTEPRTQRWVIDNSVAATIYKGAPMFIDTSADTVYPSMFVTATVVDPADIFIGIAAEGITIATADTEVNNVIEIYVWPTIIGFKSTVYTDADVGDTVYMSDNDTLSATVGDNVQIGKLERVEDGYAYVQLVTPQVCTGA